MRIHYMHLPYIQLYVCEWENGKQTECIYLYSNSYNGGGGVGGENHNIKWVRARGAADAPT